MAPTTIRISGNARLDLPAPAMYDSFPPGTLDCDVKEIPLHENLHQTTSPLGCVHASLAAPPRALHEIRGKRLHDQRGASHHLHGYIRWYLDAGAREKPPDANLIRPPGVPEVQPERREGRVESTPHGHETGEIRAHRRESSAPIE